MKLELLLILLVLTVLVIPNAFASSHKIDVFLDKTQYYDGDTIFITGYIDNSILVPNEIVYYRLDTNGGGGLLDRLIPNSTGYFETTTIIDDNEFKWRYSDEYTAGFYYLNYSKLIDFSFYTDNPKPIINSVITDKQQYHYYETVYISGDVAENVNGIDLSLNLGEPSGIIIYSEYLTINTDNTFNTEFNLDGPLFDTSGIYSIYIGYESDGMSTSFELLPRDIQFQTDKSEYYANEKIKVNGTMANVDPMTSLDISYEIYENSNIISSGGGGIINTNGTFNFEIYTDDTWYSGTFDIIVIIQGVSSDYYTIIYENIPNMENETLYDYIMDNQDTLLDHEITMNQSDQLLDNHNSTINDFELRLSGMESGLVLINPYLGVGVFPPQLADNTLENIEKKIIVLVDGIKLADDKIIKTLVRWETAKSENKDTLALKLEGDLGSLILTREIYNSLLTVYNGYFTMYSQY